MGCAWDHSANHRSSVDDTASVGSAATRDCSRLVKARSGACFSNRVLVRWPQVCPNERSQKRCRAINSGLEPMRVPHVARSTSVDDDRASEQQDASDVLQCNRRLAGELNRRAFPLFDNGTGFRKAFTTNGRSATHGRLKRRETHIPKKTQGVHTTTQLKKGYQQSLLRPQRPATLPSHFCFLSPWASSWLSQPFNGERKALHAVTGGPLGSITQLPGPVHFLSPHPSPQLSRRSKGANQPNT